MRSPTNQQTSGTGTTIDPTQAAIYETTLEQKELAEAYIEQDQDPEENDEQETDSAPEPPETEDSGNSDSAISGKDEQSYFDMAWFGSLPLIKQLPFGVRPRVKYFIDKNYQLHSLQRENNMASDTHYRVASAIAKHIENNKPSLENLGDWRHIPSIGSNEELPNLIDDSKSREKLKDKIKSSSTDAKDFAILLFNGDVVTPDALIEKAQKTKVASRSGALRHYTMIAQNEKTTLAGEDWSQTDGEMFQKAKAKAKNRAKIQISEKIKTEIIKAKNIKKIRKK